MKKVIGKFSFITLLLVIISLTSNFVFAQVISKYVDKNKAYDICMKYHPPRIQDLCLQITDKTTFDDILSEHNRHGYQEVIDEKENMMAKPKQDETKKQQNNENNQNKQNNQTQQAEVKKKPTKEENQILTFFYSNYFWKIVNILGIAFFVLTYIIDRYIYLKKKKKRK